MVPAAGCPKVSARARAADIEAASSTDAGAQKAQLRFADEQRENTKGQPARHAVDSNLRADKETVALP
jgi:hypothetical protein